jgi:hypothetical protein
MQETRLIKLNDSEDGVSVLMARTNMTEEEIQNAVYDETLDDNNCDWEEKLIAHAEELGKVFERFYFDEVIAV